MTIHYSEDQREALEFLAGGVADDPGLYALLGVAGTGKTTIMSALVGELKARGLRIVTTAPTNKAVARLREKGVEAGTVHSVLFQADWHPARDTLLQIFNGDLMPQVVVLNSRIFTDSIIERAAFQANTEGAFWEALSVDPMADLLRGWIPREDLDFDVVICDEGSMLDSNMLADIAGKTRAICLVGDPMQLHPVLTDQDRAEAHRKGLPQPFCALDAVQPHNVAHLMQVHRTGDGSKILEFASALREDLPFFEAVNLAKRLAGDDIIVHQGVPVEELSLPEFRPVLCYTNATRMKHIAAIRRRKGYNPTGVEVGETLIISGAPQDQSDGTLVKNALVTVEEIIDSRHLGVRDDLGNRHDVLAFVGEAKIAVQKARERDPSVPDLKPLHRGYGDDAVRFQSAQAMTVHRSQGSEWPEVFIDLTDFHGAVRRGDLEGGVPVWRRLLYTAATRASRRLHLIT